jgi:hypothetical protein
MGVDTDVALGVASVAVGVSMGKPDAIFFGAGVLTKAISEWTETKVIEMSQAA